MLIGFFIVIGIVALWFIVTFNRFIRLKNLVRQAWSDVDVQLKRRHDLVPKLVATVKGYAGHEVSTLQQVTMARNACATAPGKNGRQTAEMALSTGIQNLFALVENYPDLKADKGFLDLQQRISQVEDRIQSARRFYNGAVKMYNVMIESFPSMVVAKILGLRPMDFFELENGEAQSPEFSFKEKRG